MIATRGEKVWQGMVYALLILVSLIMLLPVWHVLMQSISQASRSTGGGLFLWPRGFSTTAYRLVLMDRMVQSSFGNTTIVTVGGTLLNIVMTFLAAYPLSRKDLKGRSFFQYAIFFTMLFGGGMVPGYLVVNALGLTNSLWALVIPGAVSAYNIFVLRNFIGTIPESLQESARIDGAGDMLILMRIIVPLSMPVIAVLCMFYGVGHWNSWFDCIIYINDTGKYTLQPVLRQIILVDGAGAHFALQTETTDPGMPKSLQMATVAVTSIPILCVYPFLQKYFVKGVMIGAVKG